MTVSSKSKKTISLMQILSIIFLAVFGVIVFFQFTAGSADYSLNISKTRLSETARRNAISIKIEMDNSLASIKEAASAIQMFDDIHSQEALSCIQEMTKYSSFDNMRITTPNGQSWASNSDKIDISDRDYFKKSLSGYAGMTDLMESRSNGEQVFICYAPVKRNGRVIGAVNAAYKVNNLLKITAVQSFNGSGYSHIVKKDGAQVLGSQSSDALSGGYENMWDFFKTATFAGGSTYQKLYNGIQNGISEYVTYGVGNERRMAFYQPIGVNDWFIFQVIPQSAVDEQVEPINRLVFLLIGEISFIFVVMIILIAVYRYKANKETDEINHQLVISNERFKVAISHSSNIVFEYNAFTGTIEFVTDVSDLFDFPQDVPISPEYLFQLGVIDKKFIKDFRKIFSDIKNGAHDAVCEAKFYLKTGNYMWCKLSAVNLFDDGNAVYALGILEDITELKENELRYEKERQYRDAILLDAIDIYEINVTKDEYQRQFSNGEKSNWLSYEKEFRIFVDRDIYPEDIEELLKSTSLIHMQADYQNDVTQEYLEYRRIDLGDRPRWVSSTTNLLIDPASGDLKAFTYVKDIDDKKRKEIALRHNAEHDVLTGLYNRTATAKMVSEFLLSVNAQGVVHGFLMMDLDGFKRINDTYGHMAGDELLKLVASKMVLLFRASDIVARLGGDEFVVFLKDDHSEDHITAKAQELCDVLRGLKPKDASDDDVGISASIGIAMVPRHGNVFDELYKKADSALYAAKRAGRDRYVVYEDFINADQNLDD
ncbi:MAG: diguanylate cyclase [Hydrogenoanaerobacterium sp.]